MPASPRITSAPLRPASASSSKAAMRDCSTTRPMSIAKSYLLDPGIGEGFTVLSEAVG